MSRQRARHKLTRDIDYCDLRDRLSARLKRPVEVCGRTPTDTEDGAVIVICAETGKPLHIDAVIVQSCLAVTADAPDNRTNEEITLAEMEAATNPDETLDAMRGYLRRTARAEQERRDSSATGPLQDVKSYDN